MCRSAQVGNEQTIRRRPGLHASSCKQTDDISRSSASPSQVAIEGELQFSPYGFALQAGHQCVEVLKLVTESAHANG